MLTRASGTVALGGQLSNCRRNRCGTVFSKQMLGDKDHVSHLNGERSGAGGQAVSHGRQAVERGKHVSQGDVLAEHHGVHFVVEPATSPLASIQRAVVTFHRVGAELQGGTADQGGRLELAAEPPRLVRSAHRRVFQLLREYLGRALPIGWQLNGWPEIEPGTMCIDSATR